MQSNPSTSYLYDAICYRASHASAQSGFVDHAARYVLKKINNRNGNKVALKNNIKPQGKYSFDHYQWIDNQAHQFFLHYPKAVGIEIDSGLSTRFHRVSERLNWPKFSWKAINTHEVKQVISQVFPQMDNYENLATPSPKDDWHKLIDWSDSNPKIVICENTEAYQSWEDVYQLYVRVCDQLSKETPSIQIILSHKITNLRRKLPVTDKNIALISSYQSTPNTNIFKKIINKLRISNRRSQDTFIDHLIFLRA